MNNKIAALKTPLTLCDFFMQGINTLLNLNNAFFDVNKKMIGPTHSLALFILWRL